MKSIMIGILGLTLITACQPKPKETQQTPPFSQLVWSDEFDYEQLPDTSRWSWDTTGNSGGWGNNEWQHYTFQRIENAWVENNMLHIKAIREPMADKNFSSARLVTRAKGDWLYGRIEVRAKLPGTRGIWPAIWMLPSDWEYGGWPHSGEIDIMEHVGYMPDSVFGTLHTGLYNHLKGNDKGKGLYLPDVHEKFHTYAIEWDSLQIRFFVDTLHYFTFAKESDDPDAWPFNKRFHIILNVAVGGNWGASEGVDENGFPQEMVVDYVRVYQ